jgi:hypothetical protein
MGIILPKKMIDAMSWWQADILHVENKDGTIVIRNLTTKQVQPYREPTDHGDLVSRKA